MQRIGLHLWNKPAGQVVKMNALQRSAYFRLVLMAYSFTGRDKMIKSQPQTFPAVMSLSNY